ncbi:hypothetical protein WN48_04268 [Eufriesea mexicana]|nr:hypothetical protein WN48_04268 [Eufriesea mexicana]
MINVLRLLQKEKRQFHYRPKYKRLATQYKVQQPVRLTIQYWGQPSRQLLFHKLLGANAQLCRTWSIYGYSGRCWVRIYIDTNQRNEQVQPAEEVNPRRTLVGLRRSPGEIPVLAHFSLGHFRSGMDMRSNRRSPWPIATPSFASSGMHIVQGAVPTGPQGHQRGGELGFAAIGIISSIVVSGGHLTPEPSPASALSHQGRMTATVPADNKQFENNEWMNQLLLEVPTIDITVAFAECSMNRAIEDREIDICQGRAEYIHQDGTLAIGLICSQMKYIPRQFWDVQRSFRLRIEMFTFDNTVHSKSTSKALQPLE